MRLRKMRKIVSILVILVMVFASAPTGFAAGSFTDTSGHWAESSINKGVAYGFVKGYSDGTFKPDSPVSRAEFSKMLNVALGVSNVVSISFVDVPSYEWYYAEVRKAVAAGFITGYEDKTFRPTSKITRQEAAIMISKVLPPDQGSASLAGLSDNGSIADWARVGVTKVYAAGYIKGDTNNQYRPTASLSRAEAATILSRLVEGESIISDSASITKDGTSITNRIYSNDLTISSSLSDGEVSLDNCVILGNLQVNGGGLNSVDLTDVNAQSLVVAKSSGDVRVYVTGDSTIAKASMLNGGEIEQKRLSGSGIKALHLDGSKLSSQPVKLIGTFPQVYVNQGTTIDAPNGTITDLFITSSAAGDSLTLNGGTFSTITIDAKILLTLATGKITTLNVNSGASSSIFALAGDTSVTTATVNSSRVAFTGKGLISRLNVNANDCTYETKPSRIVVDSGVSRPPVQSQDTTAPTPTFTPASSATGIIPNTNITVSFDEAILKNNGNAVTNSDVSNIFEIRKGSSNGSLIPYSGSINSAKTSVTLDPTDLLEVNTTYYIIMISGTIEDSKGNENSKVTSNFKTGTQDLAAPVVTFLPANSATNVLATQPITISFNETAKYYDGRVRDLTVANAKSAILIQKGSTTITSGYTLALNSNQTVITITFDPILDYNQTYTISFPKDVFCDAVGNLVTAKSSSFTTGLAPAVSSITVSAAAGNPTMLNIGTAYTLGFTANVTAVGGAATTVTWLSSDPTNAPVSANGTVTLLATAPLGTYTVTAKSTVNNSITGSANFTVSPQPAVTGLTVSPASSNATTGSAITLTANVTAVGGAATTVTWTSTDDANAAVDQNGRVTLSAGAAGTYRITATSTFNNAIKGTATITITP